MRLHLSNLDELVQKVRNSQAQLYLNEAVVSYRAGAYRSALISTWIAVCVDIIEKIRELSVDGDGEAKIQDARLNKINMSDHKAMQDFERDILDKACDKLGLISNIEKKHLQRLKDDRNVCAHPTFSIDGEQFSPPAELALSYIVQAANYLLIHPPVKGKSVLDRVRRIIEESSFPIEEDKAYTILSSKDYLGHVKSSVVKSMNALLLKSLFKGDGELPLSDVLKPVAALGAMSRIHSELYSESMEKNLCRMLAEAPEFKFKRLFLFLNKRPSEWAFLDDSNKARLDGLIQIMSADDLSRYQVVELAGKLVVIEDMLKARLNELSVDDKIKLLSEQPSIHLKDEIISMFISAKSFNSAEKIAQRLVLPISTKFGSRDVKKILNGACDNRGQYDRNQIIQAGGIEAFFCEFYHNTKIGDIDHAVHWDEFTKAVDEDIKDFLELKKLISQDQFVELVTDSK